MERSLRPEPGVKARLRRLSGDALASTAVVVLVLVMLMSIDLRVREQVRAVIGSTSHVQDAGSRLGALAGVLFEAARTQSVDHAPLMLFVAAATVLVLVMVRT